MSAWSQLVFALQLPMHVNFVNSTPSTSRDVNPENAAEQKFLSAKVESNGRNFRERTGAFQKKKKKSDRSVKRGPCLRERGVLAFFSLWEEGKKWVLFHEKNKEQENKKRGGAKEVNEGEVNYLFWWREEKSRLVKKRGGGNRLFLFGKSIVFHPSVKVAYLLFCNTDLATWMKKFHFF